jgi:membrane-associated phospholipid phosphatase
VSSTNIRRLAAGTAVAAIATLVARRRVVDPSEHAVFRSINELPDALHPPLYVVMQAGSLGAVFAVAGVAKMTGRNRLAVTSAVAGITVWGGCKIVKQWVGRGRPAAHVDDVRLRGTEERGLGFPSGHAAVATTLTVLVAPELPAAVRPLLVVVPVIVATGRIYVGAHLPLDVVGGAAIGLAAGSATRLLT